MPTSSAEFLDLLAHELRAPLFPIIALSDLLLHGDERMIESGEWKQHLELIAASGKTLLELIDDLLGITRIDTGRSHTAPGPVSLAHFAGLVASKHAGARITVSPRSASEDVYTDRDAVDRVASCLLSHVAADAPGRPLELELEATASQLAFRTSTAPMSEAEREGLFAPFWQRRTEQSATRPRGLALSLARRHAELLGGAARAIAREGEVVLEVSLPSAPIDRAVPMPVPRRIAIGAGALARIYPAALTLLALGHDVRVAQSATELASLAEASDVELVIADSSLAAPPPSREGVRVVTVDDASNLSRAELAAIAASG